MALHLCQYVTLPTKNSLRPEKTAVVSEHLAYILRVGSALTVFLLYKMLLNISDCDMYMYGEQCESHCGWCYDKVTCHPISGICGNEICSEGFIAPYCKDGKMFNTCLTALCFPAIIRMYTFCGFSKVKASYKKK